MSTAKLVVVVLVVLKWVSEFWTFWENFCEHVSDWWWWTDFSDEELMGMEPSLFQVVVVVWVLQILLHFHCTEQHYCSSEYISQNIMSLMSHGVFLRVGCQWCTSIYWGNWDIKGFIHYKGVRLPDYLQVNIMLAPFV